MESLVHYQTMLVQRHNRALGDDERERLRSNSLKLLQQLEAQDPLRKQRYRDIGQCSLYHNSYHRRCEEIRLFTHSCAYSIILCIKWMTSTTILILLQDGNQTDAG